MLLLKSPWALLATLGHIAESTCSPITTMSLIKACLVLNRNGKEKKNNKKMLVVLKKLSTEMFCRK